MQKYIHYFCNGSHTYTLGVFAAFWAKTVGAAIRIYPYQTVPLIEAFEGGAFIFTDLERISSKHRAQIGVLADGLQAAGGTILNHPGRVLRRFDLLRALHRAGINDFDAYRVDDWRDVQRFPVFIRHADQHVKPLTDLLPDQDALRQAIENLPDDPRGADRIIVEFGNAPAADGRFFKYSAFRVGDHDYASEWQSSDNWWVKHADSPTGAEAEKVRDFARDNPHRDQLRAIWSVGHADYGRVDYCMVGGRVQVFEINTNPTIAYLPDADQDQSHYAERHETALCSLLDGIEGPDRLPNRLFKPGGSTLEAAAVSDWVMAWGREHWAANWAKRPDTDVA